MLCFIIFVGTAFVALGFGWVFHRWLPSVFIPEIWIAALLLFVLAVPVALFKYSPVGRWCPNHNVSEGLAVSPLPLSIEQYVCYPNIST